MDLIKPGIKQYRAKKYEASIVEFDKIINNQKHKNYHAIAYVYKSQSLSALGQYKKAVDNCSDSMKIKIYKRSYLYRSVINNLMKHYNDAIKDCNVSIQLKYHKKYTYYNRGIAYYNISSYKEAIEDFDVALAIDNSFTDAIHDRALASNKLKYYETMENKFENLNIDNLVKVTNGYRKELNINNNKIFYSSIVIFLISIIIVGTTTYNVFTNSDITLNYVHYFYILGSSFISSIISMPIYFFLKNLYKRNELVEKIIIREEERLHCITTLHDNDNLKKLSNDYLNNSVLNIMSTKSTFNQNEYIDLFSHLSNFVKSIKEIFKNK